MKKKITYLFDKGQRLTSNQFTIFFTLTPNNIENHKFKVGFGVNSKKIPLAVTRNRIKRLLREVFRLNKPHLIQQLEIRNSYLSIFILYNGNFCPDKVQVGTNLLKLITKLLN